MLRRRVAGILVLALAAGGVWYWDQTRFPATEEAVAGTPITIRHQDGLEAGELAIFRRGLVLEQRFLRQATGVAVRGPVDAKLAHGDPCEPFLDAGGGGTGMAGDDWLCVDAKVPVWSSLVRDDPVVATGVSAHELVHVWQAERGCRQEAGEREFTWLTEGMATDFAWRALVAAKLADEPSTGAAIRRFGAFDTRVGPLRTYERSSGSDPEYALWHLAVRDLLRRSGAGPRGVRRFCEAVGDGRPWRRAFAAAFGLEVERFYRQFEAGRPANRAGRATL